MSKKSISSSTLLLSASICVMAYIWSKQVII